MIEFSATVLGLVLLPWQKWLLIHMLELLPDNTLRFRTVVVLVARQNGKSTLSQVLALWFMYVYGFKLILGTAQDLDTAEEVWQGAVNLVEETDEDDNPVRPDLLALRKRVVMVNGKKSLDLTTGERYKVKAATRRGGRGLSGDLVMLDELREHQSWDAWGAITKTTMARSMALILALSNAGDAASIVLRYLRMMAHASIGDPDGIAAELDPRRLVPDDGDDLLVEDDDSLAIFEWSAPPECSIRDRGGWAQANPALGHMITERTIASACRTDPEWVFRTEVLCQWSDGSSEGPFPPGAWEKSNDDDSQIAADSPVAACVDVSWDRSAAHVAVAGWRADGVPHVEVVASRAGTDWVIPWLAERDGAFLGVAAQSRGAPVASLVDGMRDAGVPILDWAGADLGAATGAFYDAVRAAVGEGAAGKGLRHLRQPVLDVAAATAVTRPIADSWVWDRKRSPTDAAPLVAATGALWALFTAEAPATSAYEDHDLLVIA